MYDSKTHLVYLQNFLEGSTNQFDERQIEQYFHSNHGVLQIQVNTKFEPTFNLSYFCIFISKDKIQIFSNTKLCTFQALYFILLFSGKFKKKSNEVTGLTSEEDEMRSSKFYFSSFTQFPVPTYFIFNYAHSANIFPPSLPFCSHHPLQK